MDRIFHIWPEQKTTEGNLIVCSATLETPDGDRDKLFYKIPAEWENALSGVADPYLIASIFPAMAVNAQIHVHGDATPSLLANLEEFQAVWNSWKPDLYKRISLTADHEIEHEQPNNAHAIISFSGGVDSCFSAYRHVKQIAGRQNKNIQAGVMTHGFDIPLKEEEMFKRAAEKSSIILSDLKIPLITISTNWREIKHNRRVNWEDTHATAIASTLHLFTQRFNYGLIAGTEPYNYLLWGSNPLSDPMLSSNKFKIIHDAASNTRIEKVKVISNWEAANNNIRVCWAGQNHDKNCSKCEKCVRTILEYRVTGNSLPPCFENDVTDEQILSIMINNDVQLSYLQSILAYAISLHLSKESWVQALNKRINLYYHKHPKQKLVELIRILTN